MNTNIIKNVAIFAMGVTIGSFTTVMVIKKKYEAILQEELASVREYKERQRGGRGPGRRSNLGGYNDKGELKDLVRKYNGGDVEAADAMMDEVEEKVDANYHEYEKMSKDANRGNKDIYIITTEEFSTERPDFDKSTIYYYEDDATLADENEEQIVDVEELVGDALDSFGEGSDDPEVVYVRNEQISIDYEIVRLNKSYADTAGI